MSRRRSLAVLRNSLVTLYLGGLSGCARPLGSLGMKNGDRNSVRELLSGISPIDRTLPLQAERKFSGDNPEIPHGVLWPKTGPLPLAANTSRAEMETAPVVIIGGGISGLTSAYLLRDLNPIVLEQAPRFGGNAKGESFSGLDYSIGAAYFIRPEEDSLIDKLFRELRIDELVRYASSESFVELNGSLQSEFWDNKALASTAKAKSQQDLLHKYFLSIWNEEIDSYPDIPYPEAHVAKLVRALDEESFKAHLERKVGGKLEPIIETLLEHYCWSSMGGSLSEVSAAGALNFYCAEFGELGVCPGGNAAVAERLLERIVSEVPGENLRTGSLVHDVQVKDDGVYVTYRSSFGESAPVDKTIRARAVVMACPKFVVKRILGEIEADRLSAISQLSYRAYLVANVVLKKEARKRFYDLFLLGEGKGYPDGAVAGAGRQGATDVILANFAGASDDHTVLTLYRGLPYDHGRTELYVPTSYDTYRAEFENQIANSVLPLLGFKSSDVLDLRLARWGHPLPLAKTGLLTNRVPETLRKPFRDRVFFVEQDNWALPAIETALSEALLQSASIRKVALS